MFLQILCWHSWLINYDYENSKNQQNILRYFWIGNNVVRIHGFVVGFVFVLRLGNDEKVNERPANEENIISNRRQINCIESLHEIHSDCELRNPSRLWIYITKTTLEVRTLTITNNEYAMRSTADNKHAAMIPMIVPMPLSHLTTNLIIRIQYDSNKTKHHFKMKITTSEMVWHDGYSIPSLTLRWVG